MTRSWQMLKSDSLNSYGTLKPRLLNFRRSSRIAWNQAREKSSLR